MEPISQASAVTPDGGVCANNVEVTPKKLRKKIKEEGEAILGMPTNNIGTGNIAGAGVGKYGEPGIDKKKQRRLSPFLAFIKRKAPQSV